MHYVRLPNEHIAEKQQACNQSELIETLGARQQMSNMASWLNMRCGIEYDVDTTLTILERKIKTLRQRMRLQERLNGRIPILHNADDPIAAGQDNCP